MPSAKSIGSKAAGQVVLDLYLRGAEVHAYCNFLAVLFARSWKSVSEGLIQTKISAVEGG